MKSPIRKRVNRIYDAVASIDSIYESAVAYPASEDAEYIDGEVITVDGGYSMV